MKNTKKLRIIISAILVILCMATVFYFSSQTANESQGLSSRFAFLLRLPFGQFIVRKFAHFSEFALLGFLDANLFYQIFGKHKPVFSIGLSVLYAVSDEIHQIFVEGRACRFLDVCVDSAGVLLGTAVLIFIVFIFKRLSGGKKNDGQC